MLESKRRCNGHVPSYDRLRRFPKFRTSSYQRLPALFPGSVHRLAGTRAPKRSPSSQSPEPLVPLGHSLSADGSTALPLAPPADSQVRLCPERSGAVCYYNESNGFASWDAPSGSRELVFLPLSPVSALPGAEAPFSELPPRFPEGLGFNALRGTSWIHLPEDCQNRILLYHTETGCMRNSPWISLRTAYGCVFFVNLVSHQTRWLPPHRWMEDWVSRPAVSEDGRAYGTPLDGTRFARDLLPPSVSRLRVEGGAPYLWETGLPPFVRDEHDTRLTYPTPRS